MINIDKSAFNFSSLREMLIKYNKKRYDIEQEDAEDAKSTYFFVFGDLLHQVARLCAVQYAEEVLASENPQKKFKDDFLEASAVSDLEFLEILIVAPLPRSNFGSFDKHEVFSMLSNLLLPYRDKKEQGEQFKLGYIFENLVERFCDEDLSCKLLEDIFSMNKVTEDWYFSLMPSIFKLRDWIYSTKKRVGVLKMGLNCPLQDIRYFFMEEIEKYIGKGLVDKDLNWIGGE